MWPFSVIFGSPLKNRLKELRPGMTAEDVLKVMGAPDRMAGWAKGQIWTYRSGGKSIEISMQDQVYSHFTETARDWKKPPMEEALEQMARAEGTTIEAIKESPTEQLLDSSDQKNANVYCYANSLYIKTFARSKEGLWFASGPAFFINMPSTIETIGETIIKALAASRTSLIPEKLPTEAELPNGIKNAKSFIRKAQCLVIVQDKDIVRLIPTEKEKADGFRHLPDKSEQIAAEPEALGRFVVNYFSLVILT
ncbi:MAG: hypothetical protein C5B53_06425 [Candidatus Melainabacteria bacterium]|nr:MAG: hypothetical protein C5B53_06425 [Candidatus Melainabacteria bacterium]